MQPTDNGGRRGQWWGWWGRLLGTPPGRSRRNPGRYCSLPGPRAWWGPGREQSLWTWVKRAQVKPSTNSESPKGGDFWKTSELTADHLSLSSPYCYSIPLLWHYLMHCCGWLWPTTSRREQLGQHSLARLKGKKNCLTRMICLVKLYRVISGC